MFNVNKWGLKISQFWPRVVKKQYVTRFHDITGYSSIICTHIVVNRNLLCISCHLSHFRGLGLGLKYVDTTIKTTKYYGGSFCNFLGLMDLSSIFLKKTDFRICRYWIMSNKVYYLEARVRNCKDRRKNHAKFLASDRNPFRLCWF